MTTTALDRRIDDDSSIDLLPAARRPADTAIALLQSHADMMDMAYDLAVKMCRTKLVPTRFFGKPEDGCAAILYGSELGLNPIQSLQLVIPIHGKPTLEARTMVALLQSQGYKVKTRSQSDTSVTVWGRDLDGGEYETTWTIERAIKARYVPIPVEGSQQRPEVDEDWVTVKKVWDGKTKLSVVGNMKYITDPQAMLKAKAQAEVCREIAPEVLLGLGYTREDMESEYWGDDDGWVTSDRVSATAATTIDDILGPQSQGTPGRKLAGKVKKPQKPSEPAEEPQDADVVEDHAPEPQTDPGPGGGNAASEGTAAESAEPRADSQDQDQPADPELVTTTADGPQLNLDDAAPEKPERKISAKRKALETRLFKLIGEIQPPLTRDDRILVYQAICKDTGITSTVDLGDGEVGRISDQLFKWSEFGGTVLNDHVRDIINTAAMAEENAKGGNQ